MKHKIVLFLSVPLLIACSNNNKQRMDLDPVLPFYDGADLSYLNEMEDCGARFKNLKNEFQDPFKIFSQAGAEIIRVRLWNNPKWTNYSNLEDVKKTIRRSKAMGMKVLLDFHFSDTWADPSTQIIPEDWISFVDDEIELGEILYHYTESVLIALKDENLKPDLVQIGNEINTMILQKEGQHNENIDWNRNSYLINKAIAAVRNLDKNIEIMLHIAQPENALWWFDLAVKNKITDFDWIGLSYYPKWSTIKLEEVNQPLKTLINTYSKKLMVVETAYPFTLENADSADNILDEDALISGFPANAEGQYQYLLNLKNQIRTAGGQGLIYWEPAWVSTNCKTLWGTGSHWDNATLFDFNHKALPSLLFMKDSLSSHP